MPHCKRSKNSSSLLSLGDLSLVPSSSETKDFYPSYQFTENLNVLDSFHNHSLHGIGAFVIHERLSLDSKLFQMFNIII